MSLSLTTHFRSLPLQSVKDKRVPTPPPPFNCTQERVVTTRRRRREPVQALADVMELESKNLQLTLSLAVSLGLGIVAGYLIANRRRALLSQGALQGVRNVMKFL